MAKKNTGIDKANTGVCALCGKEAKLCKSHAIPKAFFKPLTKANNGKGRIIYLSNDDKPIYARANTGAYELLCLPCEQQMNENFDKPLVELLSDINESNTDQTFLHEKFAQCIASIIWRGAHSKNKMYQHLNLNQEILKVLMIIFKGDKQVFNLCSVRINSLFENTTEAVVSTKNLRQLIFPIIPYEGATKNNRIDTICFFMVFDGFLIQFCLPRLSFTKRKSPGFLRKNKDQIKTALLNIEQFPPIMELIMSGQKKIKEGNVQL